MEGREDIVAKVEEILISAAGESPRGMAYAVVDELDIEVTKTQVVHLGPTEYTSKSVSGYWMDSRKANQP